MDVSCKRCGKDIPASDINLAQMVAKCSGCDAVFGFGEEIERKSPQTKSDVALPQGWTLLEDDAAPLFGLSGYREAKKGEARALTLRWRWFKASSVALLFFSLVWCGFIVFWYSAASSGSAPWLFFVFPLIHVAVGVGTLYSALAGLFNSTTLAIKDGFVSVRHHPLPWRGQRQISVEDLSQLYCIEQEHRNKNGTTYTYAVKAQQRGGEEIVLVKGLAERAQAFFIEQKIERALGLADLAVVGELRK